MDGTRMRTSGGKTLQLQHCSTQGKTGLEWATIRLDQLNFKWELDSVMPMVSVANRPVNEIRNEFWSGFIHSQRAAIQKRAVQRHDCGLCVADFAHFYEGESAGVAGVPI
jgi:hypothetical protein